MKTTLRLMILLLCGAGFTNCSSLVVSNFDDLSYFRKGMTMEEVDRYYDDDDMKKVHTFPIPNSPYVLKNTQVLVQLLARAQNNPGMGGFGSTGNVQTTFDYRYNTFRLLFKNSKLIFWGFDYEFLNNSDPEVRQIGEMMQAFGIRDNTETTR